jgi:hypothetical protein
MKLRIWITDAGNCDVMPDEWPGDQPIDGVYNLEIDADEHPFTSTLAWAVEEGHTIHICKED